MGKPHAAALVLLGLFIAAAWLIFGRDRDAGEAGPPDERDRPADGTGIVGGPVAPAELDGLPDDATVEGDVVYTPRDVEIFQETMDWAQRQRLDTMQIGQAVVRLGRRFVGTTYTPQTLEIPGAERVVINLRELDCVTYVESMLAMARVLRDGSPEFPAFAEEVRRIRYRDGQLNGYASRLHYFSEWIRDNEELGIVRDVTQQLGGVRDTERISFMSSNASAYPKLDGQPERITEIRQIEQRISERPRHYIPQDRITDVADRIQDGDVIAATSTVRGLDIAHTGFALWVDGRLHLMHAPLVGSSVEISSRPLAARLVRIDGQDGIMVARPL